VGVQLLGVMLVSLGAGLGEATCLALSQRHLDPKK